MRLPFALPFAPSIAALIAPALIVAAPLISCAASADQFFKVTTPEGPRQAILLPAQKLGPNPTIIVLHGTTMSAERMARSSGFAEAAAVHGFTVVFPESKAQRWNDARDDHSRADDIGFLNLLAHQLIDAKIADPQHFYLVGVANGGMMALTLICQPETPFTGIATILAALPANLAHSCHPPKPMTVVMMNGTADPLMPFGGGHVGFFGRHGTAIGALQTAELFAKAQDCTGRSEQQLPRRNAGETTRVKLVTWNGCAPQASVRLYEVEGGGHQIPGGPTFVPFLFGSPNHDIKAATEILQAFSGS